MVNEASREDVTVVISIQHASQNSCQRETQMDVMHPVFLYCAKTVMAGCLLFGNFYFWAWIWSMGPETHSRSHIPMGK